MNPLDEKINQAIQDLRDQTGHRISTTRSHILARMRHERLLRWGIGGGGTALLSLALYLIIGNAEPPSQTLAINQSNQEMTVQVEGSTDAEQSYSATALSKLDSQKRAEQVGSLTSGEVADDGSRVTTVDGYYDGFIAESTRIAREAAEAVAADELVLAAQKYRGLAQFCEARAEWRRAVSAYDSAVQYARQVGDGRMIATLTRAQSSASKRVATKN